MKLHCASVTCKLVCALGSLLRHKGSHPRRQAMYQNIQLQRIAPWTPEVRYAWSLAHAAARPEADLPAGAVLEPLSFVLAVLS